MGERPPPYLDYGDLGEQAARHKQPLLLEPLNRYETNLLNRLGDTGAFGDFIEPRRRKAAGDELVHRCLDDGSAPLCRAFGAVGGGLGRQSGRCRVPGLAIGGFRGFPSGFVARFRHAHNMTDWSVIVNPR